LEKIFNAFDEAWIAIEDHFYGESEQVREDARIRLAHAVLAVAREDGTDKDSSDVEQLKTDALQVMALASVRRPRPT